MICRVVIGVTDCERIERPGPRSPRATGTPVAVQGAAWTCCDLGERAETVEQLLSEARRELSRVSPREALEAMRDPASQHRDPELARTDRRVILICDEGYQSSLAAAKVRRLGVDATDVIGGFQAWRESGLPIAAGDRTKRA